MEASKQTDGIIECIYKSNYNSIFNNIAKSITLPSVQLTCKPYENRDTNKCLVVNLPYGYESDSGYPYLDGTKLVFSPPLSGGQEINVQYWCSNYIQDYDPNVKTRPCR